MTTPAHLRALQHWELAVARHTHHTSADVCSGKFPQVSTLFAYMAHVIGEIPLPSVAHYMALDQSKVLAMAVDAKACRRNGFRTVSNSNLTNEDVNQVKGFYNDLAGVVVPIHNDPTRISRHDPEIIRLHAQGMTTRQVSEALGISMVSVQRRRKLHGIPTPPNPTHTRKSA